MTQVVSWWDELQKVLARMEPPLSYSSPTMAKGQKNQVKMRANNIKQAFIKIKKWNTLESNSLSLVELPLWVQAPAIGHSCVWVSTPWTMAEGVNGVAT